jgi:hypothetical protein
MNVMNGRLWHFHKAVVEGRLDQTSKFIVVLPDEESVVSGNHGCAQLMQLFANNHLLVGRLDIDSVVVLCVFA